MAGVTGASFTSVYNSDLSGRRTVHSSEEGKQHPLGRIDVATDGFGQVRHEVLPNYGQVAGRSKSGGGLGRGQVKDDVKGGDRRRDRRRIVVDKVVERARDAGYRSVLK